MKESKSFCPQCRKDVTFVINDTVKSCPECGFKFEQRPASSPAPNWFGVKRGWLLFFAFLIAPAVSTFALVMTTGQLDPGSFAAVFGSGASALVCGVWCALRISRSVVGRILLCLLLVPVFYGICFGLSFAGCAAASNLGDVKWIQ